MKAYIVSEDGRVFDIKGGDASISTIPHKDGTKNIFLNLIPNNVSMCARAMLQKMSKKNAEQLLSGILKGGVK